MIIRYRSLDIFSFNFLAMKIMGSLFPSAISSISKVDYACIPVSFA